MYVCVALMKGLAKIPASALCLYYFAIKNLRLKATPIFFWLNRKEKKKEQGNPKGSSHLLALRLLADWHYSFRSRCFPLYTFCPANTLIANCSLRIRPVCPLLMS